MKTKFYYFKVDIYYIPKNRLHAEFQEYVKGLDRTLLIGKKTKENFVRDIKRKLKQLNAEHHRCKPVELSGWSGMNSSTRTTIRVDGNFSADIHLAERILKDTNVDIPPVPENPQHA